MVVSVFILPFGLQQIEITGVDDGRKSRLRGINRVSQNVRAVASIFDIVSMGKSVRIEAR